MNDEKKITTNQPTTGIDAVKKIRFGGGSPLHNRVAAAAQKKTQEAFSVATLPNRIGIMADDSGSMAGDKAAKARIALDAFINACDPSNTAVAVNTFEPTFRVSLTNQLAFAAMECQQLSGVGGTPLLQAMEDMLHNEPITQAVIISDGDADNPAGAINCAHIYKEAGIKVDCVHIGDSRGGEETLKKIASITGGMYVKFTDVSNFAQNFKYLTPQYRALLPESKVEQAKLMGAKEVL